MTPDALLSIDRPAGLYLDPSEPLEGRLDLSQGDVLAAGVAEIRHGDVVDAFLQLVADHVVDLAAVGLDHYGATFERRHRAVTAEARQVDALPLADQHRQEAGREATCRPVAVD